MSVMVMIGESRRLGVPASEARLRFEVQPPGPGTAGRRLIAVDGEPSFELSHWCGTCQFLFRRLEGSRETLSLEGLRERLAGEVSGLDDDVLDAFGALLPDGDYLPSLLRVEPRLVVPGQEGDYFSGEQVASWGVDQFWGLPEYPHTPYYRTFETAVDGEAHLYEFVVPMVPPTWNDRDRVAAFVEEMGRGAVPTAVAVSVLDVCQPSLDHWATDCHQHWGLTHFLLDGHHKLEAAAAAGRPVQLLSFLAVGEGLSEATHHDRLAALRSQPRSGRGPQGTR